MRITTWNVNGFRAVIKKGFREFVITEQPDILFIQEVKAKLEQVSDDVNLPGYGLLWNAAERPGYSGVAAYYRRSPEQHSFGMGIPAFDDEGRIIRLDYPGVAIFNGYFPNGQRGQDRVDFKLEFYACLLDITQELVAQGTQVIITGDFNTAHTEIDLANPKENQKTSGFLLEEREWVSKYLEHGFVDVYRQLYPDRVQYTWWTYRFGARSRNIGWRLDYFLVSAGLAEQVNEVVIHDQVGGSDHCPVTMGIDLEFV
jgi:exodeoxyribonuclease-3